MFTSLRIGEASHPGPANSQGCTVLGTMNLTGLRGKAHLIQQLPNAGGQSVWGVSETHLTGPGTRKFREELRYQAPGYQFRGGHPVPFKTAGTHAIGGKSKGVGFLTTAPSRLAARNEQWPGWAEARTVSCSFLLGQRWVHGGQAYGYAYAAATKAVQAQTEDLLHTLHQQVVEGCVGPRFLMGDWNRHGSTQEMGKLRMGRGTSLR